MRRRLVVALAVALAAGCTYAPSRRAAETVRFVPLAPGVFLHTSWKTLSAGAPFPSNGLVVQEGDGVLLVDTAWGEEPTEELLRWVDRNLRLPVHRALVTHAHDDRMGGARILVQHGIPLVSHPATGELAARGGLPRPEALPVGEAGHSTRLGGVEVFFPGPAHAPDNVTVWIPSAAVLFGGCLVKSAASKDLGNIADADLTSWPEAVRRLRARYPTARVVVPGHGGPGGPELLTHTLDLLHLSGRG